MNTAGIMTLGQLCDLPDERLDSVIDMNKNKVTQVQKTAREKVLRVDRTDKDKDYRKEDNPYEAKHGRNWEVEFKKSTA